MWTGGVGVAAVAAWRIGWDGESSLWGSRGERPVRDEVAGGLMQVCGRGTEYVGQRDGRPPTVLGYRVLRRMGCT